MAREIIATEAAPKAPPSYSQAVKAAGLIFVSGTAPIDPATGRLVEGPVQAQVAQCLSQHRGHPGGGRQQPSEIGQRHADPRAR